MQENEGISEEVFYIATLIRKYVQNELLTIPEEQTLREWLQAGQGRQALLDELLNAQAMDRDLATFEAIRLQRKQKFDELRAKIGEAPHRTAVWYKVAAALVLIAGAGYLASRFLPARQAAPVVASVVAHDAAPGKRQAQLELSNGSQVFLDDSSHTTLSDANAQIDKQKGTLRYGNGEAIANNGSAAISYNTLRVAKGGEYDVVLGDGTHVWLNANSSLRYPTRFTGKERQVELTGEAYFEVAKNKTMPFIVKVPALGSRPEEYVKVLGTHFNVMAYEDEPARSTTLLEGSVQVSQGDKHGLLKPGEQAMFDATGYRLSNNANLEEVMAWRNGNFVFNNTDLAAVLRQVSRWYDVEVIWQREKSTQTYTGIISRNTNLSVVLNLLNLDNGKVEINGKQLFIK